MYRLECRAQALACTNYTGEFAVAEANFPSIGRLTSEKASRLPQAA
jgi:hypothetical protein